MLKKTIEEV